MQPASYRLESTWSPDGGPNGRFTFTLFNLSDAPLDGFTPRLHLADAGHRPKACDNAIFLRRNANYHEFAPPAGLSISPAEAGPSRVSGLHRTADTLHRWCKIRLSDTGRRQPRRRSRFPIFCSRAASASRRRCCCRKVSSICPSPLQPWPRADRCLARRRLSGRASIRAKAHRWCQPEGRCDGASALFRRLFQADHAPFSLVAAPRAGRCASSSGSDLAKEAYGLPSRQTRSCLPIRRSAGRQYGLTTLAQLLDGARREPGKFRFPVAGTISDAAALRLARLPSRRLPAVLPGGRCDAADRYPRLVQAQHLPLASDRRRGMAAGDQGLSAVDHDRRPARPGRTACCRSSAMAPSRSAASIRRTMSGTSSRTRWRSASRSSRRSIFPATAPPRSHRPAGSGRRPGGAGELPFRPGLSQQCAQPGRAATYEFLGEGLRRNGRAVSLRLYPYRRRRGGERFLACLAAGRAS